MKIRFLILTLFVFNAVISQNVTIPDANFKNYLLTNPSVNTNNDSEIQVSEAEAFTGTLAFQFWFVSDLTGIEAFTNLTILDCGDNNLTSIDLSANTALEQLYCYDNQLTSLDLSANTQLVALDCRDNQITDLDVSGNPLLYYLNCPFNGMQTLNISNTAMQTLRCYSNQLSTLDVSGLTTLETLRVTNNNLTELDLSNNSSLTNLECTSNDLSILDVSNGNNANVTVFDAKFNANLLCIQVDDASYSTANWLDIDAQTSFSNDCMFLNINDNSAFQVSIFPNPTKNFIQIELSKSATYSIHSMHGALLMQGRLTDGSFALDLSSLSDGLYLVKLTTESGKTVSKRIFKY